jgi:hypothetical protein
MRKGKVYSGKLNLPEYTLIKVIIKNAVKADALVEKRRNDLREL